MGTVFQRFSHAARAFINPEDLTKPNPALPNVCVSTYSENIINQYVSAHSPEAIGQLYTANGTTPIYRAVYKGTPIGLYLSRVGAPACAAGIEEIIAYGAKKLVLFGCCGILDEGCTRGKIIVPTSAVRDEGTSYHYIEAAEEILADPYSVDRLSECLKRCGYPYVLGKTWTTDAIYRETEELIRERKAQGCIAVEMECAAAFAVAQFRQIPLIQFLYGADNLDTSKWEPRDLAEYGYSNADQYLTLAFECALAL